MPGDKMSATLPPSVLAELKRLSAEARAIHNCFNEAMAQREFRILLAENADALISAAEERDELQSSLNAIAEALFPEELMEKERKRLEIAGLKAELLDLKLRVEQTQAHLDGEVKAHLARRAAMNKDGLFGRQCGK